VLETLVEELAKRRQAKAEDVGDDVRLDELRGVAGERYRDLRTGGLRAVDGDVKRDARAGGIFGSGRGDDEKPRHGLKYGQSTTRVPA
jgi:hypothetical protein